MPRDALDNGNLIQIIEPEKKVNGLTWEQFCQALKENGWPEPDKDNNIRAAFNLADANHQEMVQALEMYSNGQLKVDQNNVDYQVEALRHAVRDTYIIIAKNDPNFTMDENKRESVLHFQEQCNRLEGERFDFNAYHPAPAREEPQRAEEVRQPAQENPQNVEQVQQPARENHDSELDHNSAVYDSMYTNMQFAYDRLEDETVGVYFGSSEYSDAMKNVKKVSDVWADLKDKDKDFQISDHELEEARQKVYLAQQSIDKYLNKKLKERKGKSLSTESGASYYRQEAMMDARKALQEQAEMLDEIAAERGMERPLPSDEKLARQRKNLADDLQEATRNVHNGSSEYKEAKNQFDRLNALWDKTMENKAEGELPSAGEIENLRASIERTRQATEKYLDKKSNLNDPKAKTEKRITAMSRVKENLEIQEKKLAEWEKKLAEQEPVKGYKDLADETEYLKNQMAAADKGVVGGSKEFKEVDALLKQQEEKWREFEKKGPDYKMTPEELKEMVELNQKMEKAVDQYIANKAGKDLSEKTQKRLRTMQKVKNHALSQRKKFEARRDEMLKEVEGLSNQEVEKNSKEASREIRNADRKVYFGSRAYSNAMKSYNRSLSAWDKYKEKEEKGLATSADRQKEYARLEADVKKIDKYLDSKKNKDLSKNPKTAKRVEAMEKAKKNTYIRMQKIALAEKRQRTQEREAQRKNVQERKTNLRTGMRSQKAMERNMSKASLAATNQLAQLGQKRKLSEIDQKNARIALATLMLEEKLKQPGNERLKAQLSGSGKAYAKAVKQIANTKEFKKAFPDKNFTPANCRNIANDQKVVQRYTKEFDRRLIAKQQVKKQVQTQQQRLKVNNLQK